MKPRIAFNRVGALPAPAGLPAPKIFLLWWQRSGAVKLTPSPDSQPNMAPSYSFTPLGQDWRDWGASGWEDCEVGGGEIEATGPDGRRYRWQVWFCHDGDPLLEFWGAAFDPPALVI